MVELRKNHYYKDRQNRLVRVISDKLVPLEMYAVLYSPATATPNNLMFVRADGTIDELDEDAMDLVKEVTCPNCEGRGHHLTRIGPDEAARRACSVCGSKGYKLPK